MKFAIIENGRVTNTAISNEALAENWIASEAAAIGDTYEDGKFIRPAPSAPEIPQSVSMRQARLAMLGAGILDDVETAIAAMEGDDGRAARIDWEYALDVRREWPLINALGSQLGLTEQQIDELFIAAAAVPQ